jgi:hypothetical protein
MRHSRERPAHGDLTAALKGIPVRGSGFGYVPVVNLGVRIPDVSFVPDAAERATSKQTCRAASDAIKTSAFRGSGPSLGSENGTKRTVEKSYDRSAVGTEETLGISTGKAANEVTDWDSFAFCAIVGRGSGGYREHPDASNRSPRLRGCL